jgi:hypothetical protein
MSARAFGKKLSRLTQEFKGKHPELGAVSAILLSSIGENVISDMVTGNALNFSDFESFTVAVENALEEYRKVEGRVVYQKVRELNQSFKALVEKESHSEQVDEMETEQIKSGHSKRKRALSADMSTGTATSGPVSLEKQKSEFRKVLNAMIKDPSAEIFLHPVPKDQYPEYYQVIAKPMDLSSIKMKLAGGGYQDIHEAISDLHLVWKNCKQFNADGSDIFKIAEASESKCESLLESAGLTLPPSAAQGSEQPGAAKAKPEKKPKDVRTLLNGILKQMQEFPDNEFFLYPVDVRYAPGYLDYVDQPMDLDTMEEKLNDGAYTSSPGDERFFALDAQRIVANCLSYNTADSEIADMAHSCEAHFTKLWKQKFSESPPKLTIAHKYTAAQPRTSNRSGGKAGEGDKADDFDDSASDNSAGLSKNSSKSAKNLSGSALSSFSQAARGGKDPSKMALSDASMSHPSLSDKSVGVKKAMGVQEHLVKLHDKMCKLDGMGLFLKHQDSQIHPNYDDKIDEKVQMAEITRRLNDLRYRNDPKLYYNDLNTLFTNVMKLFPNNSREYNCANEMRQNLDKKFAYRFPNHSKQNTDRSFGVPAPTPASSSSTGASSASSAAPASLLHKAKPPPPSTRGGGPLVLSEKAASELLGTLQTDIGLQNPIILQKAAQMARKEVTSKAVLPFESENNLIVQLGYVPNGTEDIVDSYHTASYIAPYDFTSIRHFYLAVVPADETPHNIKNVPYFSCDLTSKVTQSHQDQRMRFTVEYEGVPIASSVNAREVWKTVLSEPGLLCRHIGTRLGRCRSLLNRLSVEAEAFMFLSHSTLVKQLKNVTCNSLLWFSEIHARLVEGAYDSEFDFAYDMRHCLVKAVDSGPAKLKAVGNKLYTMFQNIFCKWILMVQDASVTDRVTGPWDAWHRVRHLDTPDDSPTCIYTGETNVPMIQCRLCGDCVAGNKDAVSVFDSSLAEQEFCKRCAPSQADTTMAKDLRSIAQYCDARFIKGLFLPAPRLGDGFFKTDEGVITSLGVETTVEQLGLGRLHDVHEESAAILLAARVEWYKQYTKLQNKGDSPTRTSESERPDMRNKYNWLPSEFAHNLALESLSAPASKVRGCRSKSNQRLRRGQSASLDLLGTDLSGPKKLVFVDPHAAGSVALSLEDVPELGYFGLDNGEVKAILEGCLGSDYCRNFKFSFARRCADQIVSDICKTKDKRTAINMANQRIQCRISEERYVYERRDMQRRGRLTGRETCTGLDDFVVSSPKPTQVEAPSLGTKGEEEDDVDILGGDACSVVGFSTIDQNLPGSLDTEQLLSLWDFLHDISSCRGDPVLGFADLVRAVVQPLKGPKDLMFPRVSQVIFDEVATNLTSLLLQEFKNSSKFQSEFHWQDNIIAWPVNILTWQTVARSILLVQAAHRNLPDLVTAEDCISVLRNSQSEAQRLIGDLIYFICAHPCAELLMNISTSDNGSEDDGIEDEDDQEEENADKDGDEEEKGNEDEISGVSGANDGHVKDSAMEITPSDESTGAGAGAGAGAANGASLYGSNRPCPVDIDDLKTIWSSGGYESVEEFIQHACELWSHIMAHTSAFADEHKAALQMSFWWQGFIQGLHKSGKLGHSPTPTLSDALTASTTHPATWRPSTRPCAPPLAPSRWDASTQSPASFGYRVDVSEDSATTPELRDLHFAHLLLLGTDPDVWTTKERMRLLVVLQKACLYTQEFRTMLKQRAPVLTGLGCTAFDAQDSNDSIADVPEHPANPIYPVEVFKPVVDQVSCCLLSRMPLKYDHGSTMEWVKVDEHFALNSVSVEDDFIDLPEEADPEPTSSGPIALHNVYQRVCAAHEVAEKEMSETRKTRTQIYEGLSSSENGRKVNDKGTFVFRSSSLGADRHGNEYWLLGAQSVSTISDICGKDSRRASTLEPQLLLRERSTGRFCCSNENSLVSVINLLSEDHPSESHLRGTILDTLARSLPQLSYNAAKMRSVRKEWVQRIRKSAKYISNLPKEVNFSELEASDFTKLLEVAYSRCIEVRCTTHFAFLTRDELLEEDSPANDANYGSRRESTNRRRRIRETVMDESNDISAYRGWHRSDMMTRVRELSATTLAVRLLADPELYTIFKSNMARSRYRSLSVAGKPMFDYDELSDDELDDEALDEDESRLLEVGIAPGLEVEQLDTSGNLVLGRYSSSKDAAGILHVPRSGIVLCCSELRENAYGFRWRFVPDGKSRTYSPETAATPQLMEAREVHGLDYSAYPRDGPAATTQAPVGWVPAGLEIHKIFPKEEPGRSTRSRGDESFAPDLNCRAWANYRSELKAALRERGRPPLDVRSVPDVNLSAAPCDFRLLRLKSELYSVLCIVPSELLDLRPWAASAMPDGALGALSANEGKQRSTADDNTGNEGDREDEDAAILAAPTPAELEAMDADDLRDRLIMMKLARRRQRMADKSRAKDLFLSCVQKAQRPFEIARLTDALAHALPRTALTAQYFSSRVAVTDECSVADAAIRVFSLDRCILYEDIACDTRCVKASARPRLYFGPKCPLSITCGRICGHTGRCAEVCHENSRIPMTVDSTAYEARIAEGIIAANREAAKLSVRARLSDTGGRRKSSSRSALSREEAEFESDDEDEFELAKSKKPAYERRHWEVNTDSITPYVPRGIEVTQKLEV